MFDAKNNKNTNQPAAFTLRIDFGENSAFVVRRDKTCSPDDLLEAVELIDAGLVTDALARWHASEMRPVLLKWAAEKMEDLKDPEEWTDLDSRFYALNKKETSPGTDPATYQFEIGGRMYSAADKLRDLNTLLGEEIKHQFPNLDAAESNLLATWIRTKEKYGVDHELQPARDTARKEHEPVEHFSSAFPDIDLQSLANAFEDLHKQAIGRRDLNEPDRNIDERSI